MTGNNMLQIQLYPPKAPSPTIESRVWARDDTWRAVNAGDVVAIPIDDIHRIVVAKVDVTYRSYVNPCFGMFGFRGEHFLAISATDKERFLAHLDGFIDVNQAAVRRAA